LLLSAFGELRRRGIAAVDLGVDSQNETGATRLYERVGMQTVGVVEFWHKELLHGQ
jgi:ribosomal protein S18 acetylase RimI-like enzyme